MANMKEATNLFITAQKAARSCEAKTAEGELNGNRFILILTDDGWQTDVTLRDGFHTIVPSTQLARAVRLIAG